MRKFIKENIMSLIKTLKEANENVVKLIDDNNYTDAYEVLAVCQEGAFSIGTTIEKEGEYVGEVISELEAYCENLYLLSTNLQNSDFEFDSLYRTLHNQVNYVEDFVKNKIKLTYEIVFLPYKASMWDSLESVWKAANQDDACNCFVIPIPYYEKSNESSSSVLKYEGPIMPKEVPITSYKSYNFKERRPDIIYIHNPFDQYNKVTSVHPAFYSYELKKYTPLLVYIPYFVTGGSVAESLQNLSVYNYMDKMVVQSKKLINFYKKSVPQEKIVALGSPKIDKIFSASNEKGKIPEEWVLRIDNKKVIFYNTSLSLLLEHGEKALKKIEEVFSCFQKRDDVVLLWRPHPLSKATLQSMRPQMFKSYCNLERKFVLEDIGILDTTPDVTLSVVISDAYIGEETSSIVHLFGVTGKPIFLLNMDLCEKTGSELKNLVGCMDAYIDGKNLWFMHCHYNALCKMNIDSGNVEIMDKVPNEILSGERLYHDVLKIDDKLYFAPNRAKEFVEYDISSDRFKKIPYKKANEKAASQFTRMIKYKDFIFLLPTNYPALVRYNIKTGAFKYYSQVVRELKQYGNKKNKNSSLFMSAMCVENELLLMASSRSNNVLEFNMDTENINIYTVGSEENNYYRMEYDGSNYWLIPNESKSIVKWNRVTGETIEYSEFPKGFNAGKNTFLNIINCGEYMLVFSKIEDMILKIDIKNGKISEFKIDLPFKGEERKEKYYNWPNNYYFVKKLDDSHIIALTSNDSSLLIMNILTQEYTIKKCTIGRRNVKLEFKNCGENLPYACRENDFVMIDNFLDGIKEDSIFNPEDQKKAYSKVIDNMDGTSGIKIHNYMMQHL